MNQVLLFCFSVCVCITSHYIAHVKSLRLNGIPFNLPQTKWFKSCDFDSTIFKAPTDPSGPHAAVDHQCALFTAKQMAGGTNLISHYTNFLHQLDAVNLTLATPFWLFLQVKVAFEYYHLKVYTFRVFVVPDTRPDAPNCLRIYFEGDGFYNHAYEGDHEEAVEARKEETLWVATIRDLWASYFCRKEHSTFGELAYKRFNNIEASTKFKFNFISNGLYQMGTPIVWDSDLPTCVGSPNYNKDIDRLIKDTECDEMFCLSPSKRPRLDPEEPAASSSNCDLDSTDKLLNYAFCQSLKTVQDSNRGTEGIRINEISSGIDESSLRTARKEFIELKHFNWDNLIRDVKFKSPNLIGYKLIIFGALDFLVYNIYNLEKSRFSRNGFFVTSNTEPGFTQQVPPKNSGYANIPNGINQPYVVALLYRKINDPLVHIEHWKKLELPGRRRSEGRLNLNLNDIIEDKKFGDINLLTLIRNSVVDAQVYGKMVNKDLSRLKFINPKFETSCNFILGNLPSNVVNYEKASINLCPQSVRIPDPFQYKQFKWGSSTMGVKNKCNDNFKLIDGSTYPASPYLAYEQNPESALMGSVKDSPDYPDECPGEDPSKIASLLSQIQHEIDFIRKNLDENYESPFYPMTDFDSVTWPLIKTRDFTIGDNSRYSPFQFFPSQSGVPESTKAGCFVCRMRTSICPHTVPSKSKTDLLTQKEGLDPPTNDKYFRLKLTRHLHGIHHLTSVLLSIQKDKEGLFVEKAKQNIMPASLQDTTLANVFAVQFSIVKTNTAPSNAASWFELLRETGADIGNSLNSRWTSFKMIRFISDEGMSSIVNSLVKSNKPFSLQLDGSSDHQNHHYVLVYIQTLRGKVPSVPLCIGPNLLQQKDQVK